MHATTLRVLATLLFAIAWSVLAFAPRASAQFAVIDVKAITEAKNILKTGLDQLKEVRETVKQVTSIVQQGKELLRIVGDPALLLRELGLGDVLSLLGTVQELNNFGRKTFTEICSLADVGKSLTDAKLNPFSSGRDLTLTVNGKDRDTGQYRAFAVFEQSFAQLQEVFEKDRKIQRDAQEKMKEGTRRLSEAKTEADREAARSVIETARTVAAQSHAQVNASAAQTQASGSAAGLALMKDARLKEESDRLAAESATPAREAEYDKIEANIFRRASRATRP